MQPQPGLVMPPTVAGNVNTISSKFQLKFKWEIYNFCRCLEACTIIESPIFTESSVDGVNDQWFVRLYRGCNIQLTVQLWATKQQFKGWHEFKILNDAGVVIRSSMEQHSLNKWLWGIATFNRDDFVRNFVRDGKAIISCELTMPAKIELDKEVEEQEDEDVLPCLEDKYEALLNDDKFSDVSLISEGKALKAHKCILARSSPVFCAMFDAEMKEKQENIVEIADIKYDVLVEMLRFIYAQKVNNIDTLAGELGVAADKYALDGLKNSCEKSMAKNLSLDNVVEFLQFGDRLRMDKLKKKAIEFIVDNSIHITDRPDFKSLPPDLLCKICSAMSKKFKP